LPFAILHAGENGFIANISGSPQVIEIATHGEEKLLAAQSLDLAYRRLKFSSIEPTGVRISFRKFIANLLIVLRNNKSEAGSVFAKFALITVFALGAASSSFAAGEKFVLISHASNSDTWWNVVQNAIKQAGEDFNVTVDYRHPANGDMHTVSRLLDEAAVGKYDGIISVIGDLEVQRSLQQIVAKKIPLITINSGTQQQSEKLGAIMHVGQPEYEAGRGAGIRARASGIKSFVCVNTFSQSPASFERCRGFAEAIGITDYRASTLDAGADASTVESDRSIPKCKGI
jgi:ABC-type sugar transport system substrate-binding protein